MLLRVGWGGVGVGGGGGESVERREVIFIFASSVVRYRRRRRVNHISRTWGVAMNIFSGVQHRDAIFVVSSVARVPYTPPPTPN